jgi:hypothetical protein
MEKRDYNGWTNYETWNANLWMSESASYYDEMADRLFEDLPEEHDEADENGLISKLADMFKDEFEENNPLASDSSPYADMLSAAISEIDWYEIAEHYIQEAKERVSK